MIRQKVSLHIGKIVKKASQLRGGGSALPGLVVEKLHPGFLRHALNSLPYGVVVVSGTNGKTTTTKIVTELLRAHGLRVFTNPSGSNFTRGIISSLLSHVNAAGKLDADVAVLELDEAYAVHFARQVSPDHLLILNVLRDQLDRFGEIDHTAKLLKKVVAVTKKSVVLNRDDPLVRSVESSLPEKTKVRYFGVNPSLLSLFPSDDAATQTADEIEADVTVESLDKRTATFCIDSKTTAPVALKLDGIHNIVNSAAALALARSVLGDKADTDILLKTLAAVRPAFGRGEAVEVDGQPLEIVLVKNPSGFRLSLKSYDDRPAATLIAINDQYADGRDMSWLWDVSFEVFQKTGVPFVSGIRAYDMALRLQYDEVEVGRIIPDLDDALPAFLAETSGPKRIFCTYTAMLKIRKILGKNHDLEAIE